MIRGFITSRSVATPRRLSPSPAGGPIRAWASTMAAASPVRTSQSPARARSADLANGPPAARVTHHGCRDRTCCSRSQVPRSQDGEPGPRSSPDDDPNPADPATERSPAPPTACHINEAPPALGSPSFAATVQSRRRPAPSSGPSPTEHPLESATQTDAGRALTTPAAPSQHRLKLRTAQRDRRGRKYCDRVEAHPPAPIDNAAIDAAIDAAASATSFGALLATEGVVTVALNTDGRLVEHHPDRTTRQLD
jgi:hypothetical protein